ncbi:MFS transporter [Stagnihabitans tardus]|uniref:MFS transporter n=1 Tax=Stagnihabitans tardus TaxID=2699202 RepID=A0AAE5BS20_9RHOB|nr:MFS transporter [Stagnihabitans tardus]NBZ87260.1 MFS transporter [Stagnihabitans tardus]
MTSIRYVLRHPTLRFISYALLLFGAHNASLYPYQSVIAIERIGLTRTEFSWLLTLASAVAVVSSVLIGVLGDQYGKRRKIALTAALCSTLGIGVMLVFPGKWSLLAFNGVLLPVASSLYGQFIALARLAAPQDQDRDAVMGTLRSNLSFAFLGMLIFWTFAFGFGLSEMAVYVTAGIASLGLSLMIWARWPQDGGMTDQRSGLRLHQALVEIVKPPIFLRVVLLGMISSAGNLYMVLVSLVFDASPLRDASDVALYVGLVAGWEVPAMLILPHLARNLSRLGLAAIGVTLYAVHLAALPLWADTHWLWVGTFFAGVGGAIIITTPIPYYQDLMTGRPGTAAAMLAVQKLASDVITALVFAQGTALGGFEAAALTGVCVSLVGVAALWLVDRRAWLMPPRAAHG